MIALSSSGLLNLGGGSDGFFTAKCSMMLMDDGGVPQMVAIYSSLEKAQRCFATWDPLLGNQHFETLWVSPRNS
jgi:hypothetical protein